MPLTTGNDVTRVAWVAGASVLNGEYYCQIVYSLIRKQKLWDTWSKTEGCVFFFNEISLPHYPVSTPKPVASECGHDQARVSHLTGQLYCDGCKSWVDVEDIAIGNHLHKNKIL